VRGEVLRQFVGGVKSIGATASFNLSAEKSLMSPTNEEVRLTTSGQVCPGKSLANKAFRQFDDLLYYVCVLLIRALEDQIFESRW
jgi:hypothetical protein